MAGVTDMPFRVICKEMGCDLTYTEMVSAKGLHYGGSSRRSGSLLAMGEGETPCAVQLFGSDPDIMAEQAGFICDSLQGKLALIDINMGCPAPKITGNGEGSALMLRMDTAERVIRAVVRASSAPVTVKFRKGWDEDHVNALEFARMAEGSGARAIALHGRTRAQMYAGRADWDIIARVVEALSIPVIGNGDVFCAGDALRLFEHTGCAAVMVARGAQGNPWIFSQIAALRRGEVLPPPTARERMDVALRHARELVALKGERAVVEMRKHIAWYCKGMPGAAALRVRVNGACSLAELEDILAGACA